MRFDTSRVTRAFVEVPRDVGEMFQTMTRTHMAFLRGEPMGTRSGTRQRSRHG